MPAPRLVLPLNASSDWFSRLGGALQGASGLASRLLGDNTKQGGKLVSGCALRCFGLWPLHDTACWIGTDFP